MSIAPVLARCFYLHTRLLWKPVNLLRIAKRYRSELHLRMQALQADVLHTVGQARVNPANHSGRWIDPGHARQFQRIFPSAQGQRCRRTHAWDMLELDLVKGVS